MTSPMDELRQASADLQQMENLTPPPELVQQFRGVPLIPPIDCTDPQSWIAERIYQMGADQELEACCEWMRNNGYWRGAKDLHVARRPKPPSLAEEALTELRSISFAFRIGYGGDLVCDTIRRALERLQQLEDQQ